MKIRSSFVANSSSSSFIIIQEGTKQYILQEDDNTFKLGENGEYEFGWENTVYRDVYSKINFAYLQADYMDNKEWKQMLFNVIKEETGMDIEIKLTTEYNLVNMKSGYIDHQSAATEGENIEMFDSKEILKTFIFSSGSYIQGGNDNE